MERMCVACRTHKDKGEMRRVVRLPEGGIAVDPTGKMCGRGAYLCSIDCLKKAQKARLLSKAFKCEVKSEVYDALIPGFESGT